MKYTPGRRRRLPAGFKDKDGYSLRPARHRERHRLQPEDRARRRGAQDVEGPARSQVEGQGGDGASRLQRRHRHPRAARWCISTAGTTSSSSPRTSSMLVQSACRSRGVVASGERPVAVNGGDYTLLPGDEEGQSGGDRLSEGGRAARGLAERHHQLRPASERGPALHRLHLQPRDPAGHGRQRGASTPGTRSEVPRRQAEARRAQAPARWSPEELEKRDEEIRKRFVEFFGA